MSQWIWKFAEFGNYHSLCLHNSRQNYGYIEPAAAFRKEFITEGGEMRFFACRDFTVTVSRDPEKLWENQAFWGQNVIILESGRATVTVRVSNLVSFPCLYIESVVETGEDWLCDDLTGH